VTPTVSTVRAYGLACGRRDRRGERGDRRQLVVRAPGTGSPRDRGVGDRVGRAGTGQDERVELTHPVLGQRLAQPLVEHVEERVLDAEDLGRLDLDAVVALECGLDDLRHVDVGVERLGQQQRDDHDLLEALGHQLVDDPVEVGISEIEERRLHPEVGTHACDQLRKG
jgi:hypothetical protein